MLAPVALSLLLCTSWLTPILSAPVINGVLVVASSVADPPQQFNFSLEGEDEHRKEKTDQTAATDTTADDITSGKHPELTQSWTIGQKNSQGALHYGKGALYTYPEQCEFEDDDKPEDDVDGSASGNAGSAKNSRESDRAGKYYCKKKAVKKTVELMDLSEEDDDLSPLAHVPHTYHSPTHCIVEEDGTEVCTTTITTKIILPIKQAEQALHDVSFLTSQDVNKEEAQAGIAFGDIVQHAALKQIADSHSPYIVL